MTRAVSNHAPLPLLHVPPFIYDTIIYAIFIRLGRGGESLRKSKAFPQITKVRASIFRGDNYLPLGPPPLSHSEAGFRLHTWVALDSSSLGVGEWGGG